ncbi:nickel-dependent hydrogenase large subunit [Candidatus Bathyarchaeota archaeon]|nr:MAG: nickel-dependent hydrogenase large subunit [Candidatus Bathyarchaeota archaeon]
MAVIVNVDPVTRIEGHLAVKVKVEGGVVEEAWSSGLLWRGLEKIVVGRDPRDAPVILGRICGVCHNIHHLVSAMAVERAAGITLEDLPVNAVALRNIIQAASTMYSHLVHLSVLAGPDYDMYGLGMENYYKLLKETILPAQRICNQIIALFGGKAPHTEALVPGGVATVLTVDKAVSALAKLKELESYVGKLIPTIQEYLDSHPEFLDFGVGCGNFLSYECYPDPQQPGKPVFRNLVKIKGEVKPLDPGKIIEYVASSWYSEASAGKPWEAPPPEDRYGKPGAYSWIKSPRYEGEPCETGPLARMTLAGYYKPKSKHGASLYDRMYARAAEVVLLLEKMPEWVFSLKPGGEVWLPFTVPDFGEGSAFWEAPRGSNAHWVTIRGGKIERYQVVSPSAWNLSPRDGSGKPGPVEQALVGTPVPDTSNPVNVVRVVRSFDPCLACACHLVEG